MREREVEKELCERAREAGGLAMKFVSPGMLGVPDRIVVLPGGRICFCEVKAPKQTPRPVQRVVLLWLYHMGFRVATVDNRRSARSLIRQMVMRL